MDKPMLEQLWELKDQLTLDSWRYSSLDPDDSYSKGIKIGLPLARGQVAKLMDTIGRDGR